MTTKDEALTLTYLAWDSWNNSPKTGDVANHTLRIVSDGDAVAPTNSPSEVDATYAPGIHKLTLTASENDGDFMVLTGISSTDNIEIIPLFWTNFVPSEVWSAASRTLTFGASTMRAPIDGDDLAIHRGDTWTAEISGLGDLSGYTKLWFTVKKHAGLDDDDATIQLTLANGLEVFNGEAVTGADQDDGTLTINGSGNLALTLNETRTALLEGRYKSVYDIQVQLANGDIETLSEGDIQIDEDVTRAVS